MNTSEWTYGAEHELADWDRSVPLPEGFKVDEKDVTIVNSNGIAADPKGELYGFGGEINTPPTSTIDGQAEMLRRILLRFPEAKVNYRSNLHLHIRVPGLREDLETLKRVSRYNFENLRAALDFVEPIPHPSMDEWPNEEWRQGALRRYRRRLVSHHTILPPQRFSKQQKSVDVQDFFEAETPRAKRDGRPLWHLAPRCAVNLRQLMETDTVEFRHFPGTLNGHLLVNCLRWCRNYLEAAIEGTPFLEVADAFADVEFPTFPRYDHDMEVKYRMTCHDGKLTKEQIKENICLILGDS